MDWEICLLSPVISDFSSDFIHFCLRRRDGARLDKDYYMGQGKKARKRSGRILFSWNLTGKCKSKQSQLFRCTSSLVVGHGTDGRCAGTVSMAWMQEKGYMCPGPVWHLGTLLWFSQSSSTIQVSIKFFLKIYFYKMLRWNKAPGEFILLVSVSPVVSKFSSWFACLDPCYLVCSC